MQFALGIDFNTFVLWRLTFVLCKLLLLLLVSITMYGGPYPTTFVCNIYANAANTQLTKKSLQMANYNTTSSTFYFVAYQQIMTTTVTSATPCSLIGCDRLRLFEKYNMFYFGKKRLRRLATVCDMSQSQV